MTDPTRRRLVAIADTAAGLALVGWVGGHAALGAFAARVVFRDLPRALAAPTMTTIFRDFDNLIVGALVVLLVATVVRAFAGGFARRADQIAVGAAVALILLGTFEVAWVHPHIEALFHAGRTLEPEFQSLHRLSSRCAHVEIFLTLTIFASQSWSRRPS
jgi:hypothetical protein